ncbi:hypothetical protein E1266_13610 [Actinomadura sp. 7K534]|nr:hypothetical protein E1266_13610 [Actinomadura sp. 7K534]
MICEGVPADPRTRWPRGAPVRRERRSAGPGPAGHRPAAARPAGARTRGDRPGTSRGAQQFHPGTPDPKPLGSYPEPPKVPGDVPSESNPPVHPDR